MTTENSATPNAAPSESFVAQMERFGGFSEPSVGDAAKTAAPASAAKKNKRAPSKSEKATSTPAVPPVSRRAQLETMAAENGFAIQDGRLVSRERLEFGDAKRRLNERAAAQEREVLQRLEHAKSQFSAKLTKAQRIEQAAAMRDYDGLAQVLGLPDWNGLQEHVIATISDPSHKRLKELEQAHARQQQQAEQARQQQERAWQAQQRQQALQAHTTALVAQMKQSPDPLVAALHDDPQFIASVIEIQRQHWDGRSTVSPEKAIKIAAKGFVGPLESHMRNVYTRLHHAFSASQVPPSGPPSASGRVRRPTRAAAAAAAESAKPSDPLLSRRLERAARERRSREDFSRKLAAAIAEDQDAEWAR